MKICVVSGVWVCVWMFVDVWMFWMFLDVWMFGFEHLGVGLLIL